MARKFLTPLELESVSNATGDILTLSGGVVSLRTATQIRSDIGAAATSHNHTLDSLSNVTITSNANGEILRWNGSAWINNTLAEAGIAASSHTHSIANVTGLQTALNGKADSSHSHSASDIDSGTFNIARIPTGTSSSTVALGNHLHTGVYAPVSHSHAISDVTGLQDAIDGKSSTSHNHTLDALSNVTITSNANGEILRWNGSAWINNTLSEAGIAAASHTHTIANVTGLQGALDDKADVVHTHTIANVTGLQSALEGKANTSHVHAAGDVTSGTFGIDRIPTGTTGSTVAFGNHLHTGVYAPVVHDHDIGDVTGLQAALDEAVLSGANNVFTGDNTFTSNITSPEAPGLASHVANRQYVDESLVDESMRSFMINPLESGEYYLLFEAPGILDLANVTTAGTGTLSFALSTGGGSFTGVSGITPFASGDVLQVTADIPSGEFLTISIPEVTSSRRVLSAYYFNPQGNGSYTVVFTGQTVINFSDAVESGTGVVTYDHLDSTGTPIATDITGEAVFNSEEVLRVNVTGFDEWLAITIPVITSSGGGGGSAPVEAMWGSIVGTIANQTDLSQALDSRAPLVHAHSAGDITSGTLALARIPTGTTSGTVALGNHTHTGYAASSHTHNASDINAGTLADARIPNLNASKITAGTLPVSRGGTGLATITSGSFLRGNGTGAVTLRTASQVLSDIGAAPSSHGHAIADVTGLQAGLDGKAASSHTHSISNVTGLQSALDGKAATSHNHAAGDINSGTFAAARIPNLNASKINAGTFADARIPNLNASKITAGTLPVSRGGTGVTSLTAGNYLRGAGTQGIITLTPAQVRSDIGAQPVTFPVTTLSPSSGSTTTISSTYLNRLTVFQVPSGGSPRIIRIPADSTYNAPIGSVVRILHNGTGTCELEAAAGVTFAVSPPTNLLLNNQQRTATLYKVAANTWVGSLS